MSNRAKSGGAEKNSGDSASFYVDVLASLKNLQNVLFTVWINYVVRYRRTMMGPIWIILTPATFILTVGVLFGQLGQKQIDVFFPHLAVGYVVWILVANVITTSPALFFNHRTEIMQAGFSLIDIVLRNVILNIIQYLHQILIPISVIIYFGKFSFVNLVVSFGYFFILIMIITFISVILAIVGARFRDLGELVQSIMRLAFLVTPIIWIAGEGRGKLVGAIVWLNPFTYMIELVRMPLLGQTAGLYFWGVVFTFLIVSALLARYVYQRFGRYVPLWC